jgi:hypothetical protein
MKEMAIRISPNNVSNNRSCFEHFDRIEVLAHFDFGGEVQTKVCRIRLREGVELKDLMSDGIFKDFIVLQQEGQVFTGIVKGDFPNAMNRLFRKLEMKLVLPLIVENGTYTCKLIGSTEELHNTIIALEEQEWKIDMLAVKDYNPNISGIFNVLTKKQKEILIKSYQLGYFDYPRRINAEELAEKMGMHKTTLIEHIHKAEKRLIGQIITNTESE